MMFLPWRALQCLHFPVAKTHEDITVKTLQWDEEMKTWSVFIAIIIIMFIYSGTVIIWDSWILIYNPPVDFCPSLRVMHKWHKSNDSKSKSAGFKWQQCSQNQNYCFIFSNSPGVSSCLLVCKLRQTNFKESVNYNSVFMNATSSFRSWVITEKEPMVFS